MNEPIDLLRQAAGQLRRPGFGRATSILAMQTTAALLKRKRLVFLIILLSVPAFISIVMKKEGARDEFYGVIPQAFFLFMIPLVSLFHAASIFADEVDGKTLAYLLLRPISRETLLTGKAIGAWTVSSVLLSFAAVAAHLPFAWSGTLGSLLEPEFGYRLLAFVGVLVFASALYTILASLAGLVLKRPILVGIIYLVIVEAVFCFAPGPPSKIAISYHVLRLLPKPYQTPEEIVADGLGVSLVEPNVVLTAIGLIVTGCVLAALAVLAIRNTDFSRGTDD